MHIVIILPDPATPVGGCGHGDVRLVNGSEVSGGSGRLEVCINNAWGTVCGNQFGVTDASVACGQLDGFTSEGMYIFFHINVSLISSSETPS